MLREHCRKTLLWATPVWGHAPTTPAGGDSCPHVFEQLPPHMWRADEECPRCATPRFRSGSSGRLKPRMPFYDFGVDRQLQVSICLVVAELIAVQRAYAVATPSSACAVPA